MLTNQEIELIRRSALNDKAFSSMSDEEVAQLKAALNKIGSPVTMEDHVLRNKALGREPPENFVVGDLNKMVRILREEIYRLTIVAQKMEQRNCVDSAIFLHDENHLTPAQVLEIARKELNDSPDDEAIVRGIIDEHSTNIVNADIQAINELRQLISGEPRQPEVSDEQLDEAVEAKK